MAQNMASDPTGTPRVQSLAVNAPPGEAFRAAAQVAAQMGWTIVNSDADTGILSATTPGVLSRWDDEVTVTVAEDAGAGPRWSRVTCTSGLASGPNVRYIGEYLDAVRARFEPTGD